MTVTHDTPRCYTCSAAPQESGMKVEVHHIHWQELLMTLGAWTSEGCQQLEEMLKHSSSVFVHAAADVAGAGALIHPLLVCRRGDS